jgi:hypothetical protein
MRISTVRPEDVSDEVYDLAICCLGYETRATRVPRVFFRRSLRRVCLGFNQNLIHSYQLNLDYYQEQGLEIHANVGDEAFELTVRSVLTDEFLNERARGPMRVAVDISCFDRFRLAVLVKLLWSAFAEGRLSEVVFFYNIAEYSRPSGAFSFNTKLQPVHPSFVGSRPDPLSATVAVIGLGYEREKALGAAEYIEASEVFAFRPRSAVESYSKSVLKENSLLLRQLDERHTLEYIVEDCGALVSDLSSLVRGFIHRSSVLLVPLGPKVFALACLLTAMIHERVAVWRMSQMGIGETPDRLPSDHYSVTRLSR